MSGEAVHIVEDDEDILELMMYNLEKSGYVVTSSTNGLVGLDACRSKRPDVLLLDLMLPGMDGLDVCKALKANLDTESIPIIMVSAKGEESDVVVGLELGADDYVAKPFSPRVLLARLKAVLRRNSYQEPGTEDVLDLADIRIDPGRHRVTLAGEDILLTPTEFGVLHLLARRPGWVFTRQQIVDGVRGEDYAVTDRSVDVQIVGLRKKLGAAARYLQTVRGIGYRVQATDPTP